MPGPPRKPKRSSQGPIVLWHGMNLGKLPEFLAMRPPMHWSRAHRIALLPFLTAANSAFSLAEKLFFGRTVRETKITEPPLFILGHWRSGTTLLHNLVTRDPRFTFPTLYQALYPTHFLLTGQVIPKLTGFMVPKTRPMDNVKCGWHLPQEDEFALATMTLVSPYLLTAFPDDFMLHRDMYDLHGMPEAKVREWKAALDLLIRKITVASSRDGKPKSVVLKSPGHTFRIPYLLEMYPDAKFLYISRHPYDVIRSGVHMRKALVQENEFGRSPLLGHEEEVLRTYQHAFECYERDRQAIPEGNLHEMRFEDLEQDPLTELEKSYAGLGLGNFEKLKAILEPEIPALKQYKKNSFDHDPATMAGIRARLGPALERFGYSETRAGIRAA